MSHSEDTSTLPNIIIGAGPAGLAMMKELKSHGIRFVALESYENVGGLWNISNDNSPAYLSLTTNSSKGTTYLDQKAPASWPSYFSHERALEYLNDFAGRHQLLPSIRFSSRVDRVEKVPSEHWKVHFTDRTTGQRDSIVGHSVIVCTGIHSKQGRHIPKGIAAILDKSVIDFIHSSQYRDKFQYVGKRVLVVGFGNSAADIATEISEVTKRTLISTRSVPWIIPLWVLGVPADRFRGSAGALNVPFVIQNWIFHRLQRWYIGHP
nr:NAD(P)-binding domain-containing protein [Arenicellales bacterium]